MTDDVSRARGDARALRSPQDLDPVLERIGSARYVLLGEASHGTAEFYRWRAELTKRLVAEQGFSFVAVEGDWPDCHRVHCCVTGAAGAPNDPRQVLWEFARWPTWMWANEEVADFAEWLREHNTAPPGRPNVGFHGLDVYSLWDSLRDILDYLREHEPGAVDAALEAYRCFEPHQEDPGSYARSTAALVPQTCENEVVRLLVELRAKAADGAAEGLDPAFVAEQNAQIVAGAERYYREMVRGGARSWNVRDEHMTDTLDRLMGAYGTDAKAVVWAHNTHIGDARATDMSTAGMHNVGQLVRQRHDNDGVAAVGFGTYEGEVVASDRWGGPTRRVSVPRANAGTTEALLHDAVPERDSVFVFDEDERSAWARTPRGHRAIGVVFDPARGRYGGNVPTVLADRYDVFVHCDQTQAILPLHPWEPEAREPETYPFGQ